MKYLIIGSGGTGGCIGAYMTRAKKDVTMIARGNHLDAIVKSGLCMDTTAYGKFIVHPEITCSENYNDNPDVIFVCVKSYSLENIISFIDRIADKNTVVIPILNIYTAGEYLRHRLPGITVTDGCIYVAANITDYGNIKMHGDIFRVVYGTRDKKDENEKLYTIQQDLIDSNITGIVSDNIRRDTLLKFSYVSSQAACGLYYDVTAGEMQKEGEIRDCFIGLVKEINILAEQMNVDFKEDIVKRNLDILSSLLSSSSTSLQRDVEQGSQSEIDGLIYSVSDTAKKYNISLPIHDKITAELKRRGL